ncbi:helix-turn-helix domain-containing protein [Lactobacillus taiwanensis]|uniref:Transcriptional activator, Rgg/GadR/MutR family domain-containing protein n=1 Tax=Lactobacillus taiwanensis TaxID=508451 RepID=A0A256LE99_9LACO|nr:Rgg/GadR/MutR family transcriptional regulator [Lactobacillus taiwanensis]OYR88167.1 transcriptional activator, Rgg/GadR/MutR family domain-containing protein [Lactobacillus taiwanensis]OYR90322.1 transcriptional activator, Rgg/GadR/MutR family domain-containing protein [Lactobacillus taiwanensis]OYR91765.1 transcriptional activator, Rgg/GadR/MutR family domain-containing protein [Lactobacillus taiwanensis]OYR95484.1 transcriptional activator, Rgg/GadR/MutR family domain-containing protein [
MTIGELLKEYRLKKGLTQKQFADGIVSTSYYSKVEKNEHRITVEDLVTILEHNDIAMWSFFRKLSLKGDFQHEYIIKLENDVLDAYYHSDKKKVEEIREDVEESTVSNKDEYLLTIDGWLEILKKDDEEPNLEVRNALKDKIFNIPDINKDKLNLFCNFMEFYDLESNVMITKNAINKFIDSNDTESQEVLLAIMDNLLYLSIKENNFNYVNYIISNAEKLPLKPQFYFYQNIISFYKHLTNYHFNDNKDDIDVCRAIIKSMKLTGMKSYGTELEEFLNNHI